MNDFNNRRDRRHYSRAIAAGVMAYLSTAGSADFPLLKTKLQATDGNLSVQLRKLEGAGYVVIDKAFADKKPQTTVTLTTEARKAYLDAMKKLIAESGL